MPLVSYRLYDVADDDFADVLTKTDDDLTDKSSENDIYHDHDYDSQTNDHEVIRTKRGYISDAITTGRELQDAGGAIKDFVFHLVSTILKSLKKDSNNHALKGFTHRVLPWTGLNSHHKGGQVRTLSQDGDLQGALETLPNNCVSFNP